MRSVKIALVAVAWLYLPTHASAHASRCSFDPACLCITWDGEGGSTIEIRCPGGSGGGGESGWTTNGDLGGPDRIPTIDDPAGSFEGNGQFGGTGILQGQEVSPKQKTALNSGLSLAYGRLHHDPECKALFANSPLTENGAWLLSKIQWRDGQDMNHSSCDEPDVAAFIPTNPPHQIIAYLCESFEHLNQQQAAIVILHETLHAAGQDEDRTASVGPGDPPSSPWISQAVGDACNLSWW